MPKVYIAFCELFDDHTPKVIGVYDTLEGAYDACEIAKKFEKEEIYDDWVCTYEVNQLVDYEKID